jgi:plasmid replication initiation protein
VCGIDPQGDNYTALKNQIKAISDKSLWIELESGEETLLRWIERPYISKRNGTIKIKIDREMKPYLLQLKERFTEYVVIYTLNFKSKYSIRLYEYLKSIHYRKLKPYERTMDIEKFQKLLDSNYTEFKDFHTRVLKPAQKEINTYSDIIFDYEIIKEGRKAVAISFTVKTKDTIDRIKVSCQNNRILDKNIGD